MSDTGNKEAMMGVEILDCTLRDGGYYCNWDFEDSTVKRYLDWVTSAGIHIVEAGFRSGVKPGFAGKYKFCRDPLLEKLFSDRRVRVAVMIDGKDYIQTTGDIDRESLLELFRPKPESLVEMVRITATKVTLPRSEEHTSELQSQFHLV